MEDRWPKFFQSLKVLELASVLAGPSVGRFFLEHGAQVRKIESPHGGDVTRSWKNSNEGPQDLSAYYCSVNQEKTVEIIDLNSVAGQERIHVLLAESDVFLCNFKPGEDVRRGLDLHQLRKRYPQLIIGQIDAFPEGRDRPAYDIVLQAESGFLSMSGSPDALARMPVALIDLLAGHQLKSGILMALMHRQMQHEGALVRVNLWESAVASLANQAGNYLMSGIVPGPQGTLHPNIAPYGEVFRCADGKLLVLAIGNEKQFAALCQMTHLPGLMDDPRFHSNPERVKNRKALFEVLNEALQQHERKYWSEAFAQAGVPAGSILNLDEVFAEPAAAALLVEDVANGQTLRSVRMSVIRHDTE